MRRRVLILLAVFLTAAAGLPAAVATLSPSSPGTSEHLKKAQECFKTDDPDCAVEELQKVIAESPGMPQAHNLLGLAYAKKENFIQSAIAAFEEAAALDPHYAEPYFNLGTLHAGTLKDPEAALSYFEKAVLTDPDYARAYFAMAWLYLFERHDVPKALELFDQSTAMLPKLAEAYYGTALCYLQLNKREQTLGPISKLRELNREDLAMNVEKMMQPADAGVSKEGQTGTPQKPSMAPMPAPQQNTAPQ